LTPNCSLPSTALVLRISGSNPQKSFKDFSVLLSIKTHHGWKLLSASENIVDFDLLVDISDNKTATRYKEKRQIIFTLTFDLFQKNNSSCILLASIDQSCFALTKINKKTMTIDFTTNEVIHSVRNKRTSSKKLSKQSGKKRKGNKEEEILRIVGGTIEKSAQKARSKQAKENVKPKADQLLPSTPPQFLFSDIPQPSPAIPYDVNCFLNSSEFQ